MTIMSKWVPTTNPRELRRLGKLLEELGELSTVVSRCIIQGIDEIDPKTRTVNRLWLTNEISDVLTQIGLTTEHYNLDTAYMRDRTQEKCDQMIEWESFFGVGE